MIWAWAAAGAVVVVVGIAELVLRRKWHEPYFLRGLPIFRRRVHRPRGLEDVSLEFLETKSRTAAASPLEFRRIAADKILFREKPFGGSMHYLPLMRGVIRRNPEEGTVVVLGMANWFAVVFVAALLLLLGKHIVDVIWHLLAAVGILYFIQAVRFGRVAKYLREDAA